MAHMLPPFTTLTGKNPRRGAGASCRDPGPPNPEGVGVFEIEDGSGLWGSCLLLHRTSRTMRGLHLECWPIPRGEAFAIFGTAAENRTGVAHVRRDIVAWCCGTLLCLLAATMPIKGPRRSRRPLPDSSAAMAVRHRPFTAPHNGCLRGPLDRLANGGFTWTKRGRYWAAVPLFWRMAGAARNSGRISVLAGDIDEVAVLHLCGCAPMLRERSGRAVWDCVEAGQGTFDDPGDPQRPALRSGLFANILKVR